MKVRLYVDAECAQTKRVAAAPDVTLNDVTHLHHAHECLLLETRARGTIILYYRGDAWRGSCPCDRDVLPDAYTDISIDA
jgi:hypothetical protein